MDGTTSTEPRKTVGYLLPVELVRAVKKEAADRDEYPADVVERVLRAHFELPGKQRTGRAGRAAG